MSINLNKYIIAFNFNKEKPQYVGKGSFKTALTSSVSGKDVLYLVEPNACQVKILKERQMGNLQITTEKAKEMLNEYTNKEVVLSRKIKNFGIEFVEVYGSFFSKGKYITVKELVSSPQLFMCDPNSILNEVKEIVKNKKDFNYFYQSSKGAESKFSIVDALNIGFKYDVKQQEQLKKCDQYVFDKMVKDIVDLRDGFDLVHNDLHSGNMLFNGKKFTPIDFNVDYKPENKYTDGDITASLVMMFSSYFNRSDILGFLTDPDCVDISPIVYKKKHLQDAKSVLNKNMKVMKANNYQIYTKLINAVYNNKLNVSPTNLSGILNYCKSNGLNKEDYEKFKDNVFKKFGAQSESDLDKDANSKKVPYMFMS